MKPKTFIFLLLITCTPLTSVNGQKFYTGLTGGLNYSDMEIVILSLNQNVSSSRFYGMGAVFGYRMNQNIAFQLEPIILKKGGVLNIEDEILNFDIQLSSIEIPFLLKVGFGKKIKPYLISGVVFGFIRKSECMITSGPFGVTVDLKDLVKDYEFSINWGGGISLPLGNGSIFLEGNYTMGLTNLYKGGSIEGSPEDSGLDVLSLEGDNKIKTSGFRILVGLTIPLGW